MPTIATTYYLPLYNAACAAVRVSLLLYAIRLWCGDDGGGASSVWAALHVVVRWTEACTVVEVVHAAARLVPAQPLTTALQVAGRNTVVWAITRNYPDVVAAGGGGAGRAYAAMVVAWNTADAIRYLYFSVGSRGGLGSFLLWLRYNMFIVLYPIGVCSEMWLIYSVIAPSRERNVLYQYLLWFGLSLYIPAFYVLFGHMLRQRRKVQQSVKAKRN